MMASMFGPESYAPHLRHSEMWAQELVNMKTAFNVTDTYEKNAQDFVKTVADVQKTGKIPLANEHWYNIFPSPLTIDLLRGKTTDLGTNPTCLPDELFNTLTPIILIRHPALLVDSIQRTSITMTKIRHTDEDFDLVSSNKELRYLFDFFKAQGRTPIVVDGEDLLWRTDELSKNLAEKLGIDPAGLKGEWQPTTQDVLDKMNPWVRMITADIHASKGIVRPEKRPEEPSIAKMYEKWTTQYDEETAKSLRAKAEERLPHYEYLAQFKI